jgi:hypothetical protein
MYARALRLFLAAISFAGFGHARADDIDRCVSLALEIEETLQRMPAADPVPEVDPLIVPMKLAQPYGTLSPSDRSALFDRIRDVPKEAPQFIKRLRGILASQKHMSPGEKKTART